MANVTMQAQEISKTLADRLKIRFSSLAFQETTDTDGNPLLKIGSGVAGTVNAIVKTKAIDFGLAQDVLGSTAIQYTNHVIQVVTEANYAGATDNVLDVFLPQNILDLFFEVMGKGTQVEWYQSATGVAPTAAAITGTPTAKVKDLYYPFQMV